MTPVEKTILKSLVAVAWADGTLAEPESGMIDSLLWAFGASEDEENEIREFAKKKRTVKGDVVAKALDPASRELLLAHAALLTHADGKQTPAEAKLLKSLAEHLEFSADDTKRIIDGARDRAKKLAERV
jgi:tellurite resistance protein